MGGLDTSEIFPALTTEEEPLGQWYNAKAQGTLQNPCLSLRMWMVQDNTSHDVPLPTKFNDPFRLLLFK